MTWEEKVESWVGSSYHENDLVMIRDIRGCSAWNLLVEVYTMFWRGNLSRATREYVEFRKQVLGFLR